MTFPKIEISPFQNKLSRTCTRRKMRIKQVLWIYGMILIREISCNSRKVSADYPKFQFSHLSNSEGVLLDNLDDHLPMTHLIKIRQKNQNSILEMSPSANYSIQIYVEIEDAVDQFNEVHQTHDENRFVFESHQNSDIFHFRNSMKQITDKYCKHPLPKHYNIIMDSYKNRVTVAHATFCNPVNVSQACLENSTSEQILYKRSLNEECVWKENGNSFRSDENFETLQEDLNSIYCTENSPLLNSYFLEEMNNSPHFVAPPECEIAKARCIDCQMLRCKDNKRCCSTIAKCLVQDPCQTYYGPKCHSSYEKDWNKKRFRCIKGKTYKFTLIPEFDFSADDFMCYLKRDKKQPKITLTLTFSDKTSRLLKTKTIKYSSRFSDLNRLEFGSINVTFQPSSISTMQEIILKKNKFEFHIYALKQRDQFDTGTPNIRKLFSKSFIEVQMSKPFRYNTETWSSEKCQINISEIYKAQPLYDPSSKIPIEVIQKQLSNQFENRNFLFSYGMVPNGLETSKILIQISEKSSLLSFYFCHNKDLDRPRDIRTEITNLDENIWNLYITGRVNSETTFFSISLSHDWLTETFFHTSDIIVHKPDFSAKKSNSFNISFQISDLEVLPRNSVNFFILDINQCGNVLFQRIVFFKKLNRPLKMIDIDDPDRPIDISNFILIIFLATICICFFYFLLLAFQAARRSSSVPNMKLYTSPRKISKKMNYKLFLKIVFYMTLKLFYTVSFTLSLVLSVCLSLSVFTIHSSSHQTPSSIKGADSAPIPKVEVSQYSCNNSTKTLSKHFLVRLKHHLTSQEIVRTTSGQSTQSIAINTLENISFAYIHESFLRMLNSQEYSHQLELQRILKGNIETITLLNNSKWFALFHNWKTAVPETIQMNSDLIKTNINREDLRISNFLKIHEFYSVLQNCKYLSAKIARQKENLKLKIRSINTEFRFNSSVKLASQKRFFTARRQTCFHANSSVDSDKYYKLTKNSDFLNFDIFKIRLIFMLIDAALILYRCYWTYLDIRQMWTPKKHWFQLNQILMKTNQNSSNVRAKSNIAHWTKSHHLECLVSTHLAIAATIIFLSIICMNLLVLLTSRDYSNWLSKKAGNTLRMRSLKDVKAELSKFNNVHMNSVHRHWQSQKISKLRQFMGYRKETIARIMHFELFLNHQYLYELCSLQNLSLIPKWSLDFCQTMIPNNNIIPDIICDKSLSYTLSLTYNVSSHTLSRTVIYIYQPLYLVLNVLALILFATSVIGLLKVLRKVMESKCVGDGEIIHIILRSHNQMCQSTLKNPKTFIQMKRLKYIPNVYNSNLEPPNQYQCKGDSNIEETNTSV